MDFCSWSGRPAGDVWCAPAVKDAVELAIGIYRSMAVRPSAQGGRESQAGEGGPGPLIYIGGSTYVVSEAVNILQSYQ